MKQCSHCKTNLPLEAYACQTTGKQGRRSTCKECVKRFGRSKHGLAVNILSNQKESSILRGYNEPTYSLDELEQWLALQSHFDDVFDHWVESGYSKDQKPSVDRINDYISYTLDNIQLLTWEANNQKNYNSRMNGTNNKTSLAVDMLSMSGAFISRFYSVSEAARQFNGVPSNIIGAIHNRITRCKKPDGTYRTKIATVAYGHKWRYSIVPNDNTEIPHA